ncbi:MAG TPA: hypothetical protein VG253_23650 [Streptosporangiaceae bacterium]|nr:hypothetical protein [Streptosporangiaceae bacterium]
MAATCVNCGLPVVAGIAFCGNCGRPTADILSATAVPQARSGGSWPPGAAAPAPGAGPLGAGPLGADGLDAAGLDQATDVIYRGRRLAYDERAEQSFDPVDNRRLLAQFAIHGLLYLVVYLAGGLLAWLVLLLLAVAGMGFGTALSVWWVGGAIVGVIFLCLYWLIPVPAQLSEWRYFVDGKASAAPMTFDHIAWALQQRQAPLDLVQVRRLKVAGGEGRDYLEIRQGLFSGLICCFAYGRDLYVGWTFWLRLSPLRWLLMLIGRTWQTLMRRGTGLYVSLRYDYARAMREAMHSSAREGAAVAAGQARPEGQGAGRSMPVAVADIDQ